MKCRHSEYTPYGDKCYWVTPTKTVDWGEAFQACDRADMSLVSIHSKAEATFLAGLLDKGRGDKQSALIGLSKGVSGETTLFTLRIIE